MLSEITERRQQAVSLIEDMATAALARIYGPDHALRFISNEGERQEGKATNFTMRLQVVSKYKGQELVTGLIGSVGGGLIEAVAFALRIAFLSVLGWNGPVLLDEAYSAMSADGKLQALAGFLKETCELTGRQIIFVTHAGHGFREVADRIIHVSNEDGEAVVRYVDASHIPSLPASEGW